MTYRDLVESVIMDFDKLGMKPVADMYREELAKIDAEPENYTATQALAVIACTEACQPPQVVDGVVTQPEGFSAKGHRDCVLLAQKTLGELR